MDAHSSSRGVLVVTLTLLLFLSFAASAQQGAGLSRVLSGNTWQAQSVTLAGSNLTVTFIGNGSLVGFLTAGDLGIVPAQRITGTWRVIGSALFLNYVYNTHADTGYTLQVIPSEAEVFIEITEASEGELLGVDGWKRVWLWQRLQ